MRFSWTLVLSLVPLACSSSSAPEPGGTSTQQGLEPACVTLADVVRDAEIACGMSPMGPARDRNRRNGLATLCTRDVRARGSGINASVVDGLTRTVATSCPTLPVFRWPDVSGTLPDGAACAIEAQCASGHCRGGGEGLYISSCGTCAQRAPIGAACDGGRFSCVPGAYCQGTPGTKGGNGGTCAADTSAPSKTKTPGLGEACVSFQECARGLFCGSEQRCIELRDEGASCYGPSCKPGLVCDEGRTGTCLRPTLVADGQVCGGATLCDGPEGFCAGGRCKAVPEPTGNLQDAACR